MLSGMVAKGEQEKHEEQADEKYRSLTVQFAAFKQFCDDTSTEKTRAIKVGCHALHYEQGCPNKTELEQTEVTATLAANNMPPLSSGGLFHARGRMGVGVYEWLKAPGSEQPVSKAPVYSVDLLSMILDCQEAGEQIEVLKADIQKVSWQCLS
eukprot:4392685-Amphidinium_carterae.1